MVIVKVLCDEGLSRLGKNPASRQIKTCNPINQSPGNMASSSPLKIDCYLQLNV